MTQKIIDRLDQLINYLQPLLTTSNCHMVDFFTKNIFYTYVSTEIRQEINHLGNEETLNIMLTTDVQTDHCPALQKFMSDCLNHTLPKFKDVCLNLSDLEQKLIDLGCQNLSGVHLEVFMSSKKSYEVEIMSEISSAISQIAQTKHLVDIGDGKGYLSSTLALHNGLKVLGIDSSDINTKSAAKRVKKLNKIWKSISVDKTNKTGNDFYKQTTKYVTEDVDLISLVEEHFHGDDINKLSLVGLHTCGNLASSCLRIFINNPNVKTICNVGCCYHFLTENYSDVNSGFPMSNYLKEKQFTLGRNAKMLSCQSLDRILDKKELPSEILFYRSLLQILILKYCPELVDKHVGRFGQKATTFTDYINKAFVKFGTDIKIPEKEINELYETYKPLEKHLQIFYLIRAYIAPVIESVILLDRLLFLHEQNINNAFVIQLFDPVISPRCYCLVAFKNESVTNNC